jgi:hypothetical protein
VRGAVVALVAFAVVGSAAASPSVGFDISYPQCGGSFPNGGAFGIAGVNDGLPFSANPCLGQGANPSELQWAGLGASLYANTADPGPALSSHWPSGQTTPKECDTATNPGSDTPECHYDYGWNAAQDSYQDAVNAYVSLGWAAAGATRTPVANNWWLDVETANSWTSTPTLNVQALQGEADYFVSVGASSVGFYSSPSAWQTITDATAAFSAYPSWVAGASSLADAQSLCGSAGFTGGSTSLVQFVSGGFDNDYSCTAQPQLQFSNPAFTMTAGNASGPYDVQLSQAAPNTTAVSLSSNSASGQFSTSPTGPWTTTIAIFVAANSSVTPSFYYEDTKAATPVLTATASGYTNTTQTETVIAAPLASMTISPANPKVKLGSAISFTAAGADLYGNPVAVSPSWNVAPNLGSFSTTSGTSTTFAATGLGSGTITSASGSVTATTPITVVRRHRQ